MPSLVVNGIAPVVPLLLGWEIGLNDGGRIFFTISVQISSHSATSSFTLVLFSDVEIFMVVAMCYIFILCYAFFS